MSETPSGVAIRSATRKDIPDVLALWERARSAAARTADDPEVIGRLLDRDPDSLLIAELDGRLVGTLIAASDGWRGNMYRLAVAEDARRQGLGRRLVEKASNGCFPRASGE